MFTNKVLRKTLAFALSVLLVAGMIPESIQASETGETILASEVGESIGETADVLENETEQEPELLEEPLAESEETALRDMVSENSAEESMPEDGSEDVISEYEVAEGASTYVILKLNGVELPNNSYPGVRVQKDTTNGIAYCVIENLNANKLYCNCDLVLIIKGDNKILSDSVDDRGNSYAVDVQGKLTVVTGGGDSGTLTAVGSDASGTSAGIRFRQFNMPSVMTSYTVDGTTFTGCSSKNVTIEARGGNVNGTSQKPGEGSFGMVENDEDVNATTSQILAGNVTATSGAADRFAAGIYTYRENLTIGGTAKVKTVNGGNVNGSVRDGYGIGAGICVGRISGTNGGNDLNETLTIQDSADVEAIGAPVYRSKSSNASRSYGIVASYIDIKGGTTRATGSNISKNNSYNYDGAGESFGIYSRSYSQTGGTVNSYSGNADTGYSSAYSSSIGLYTASITMSGGTLTARSGSPGGSSNAWNRSSGIYCYSGQSSELSGTANVTAIGGNAVADKDTQGYGAYGMYVSGSLAVKDSAKLSATAGRMVDRKSTPENAGLYIGYDMTVSGSANVTGTGGPAEYGNISFASGENPTNLAPDNTYGIEVINNLTVNGGSVTGTGGNVNSGRRTMSTDETADTIGIYVKQTATFAGGSVSGTGGTTQYGYGRTSSTYSYGDDSYGIYTKKVPVFSGATVNAKGGEVGKSGYGTSVCRSYGLYYGTNSGLNIQYGKLTAQGYIGAVGTNGTVTCNTPVIYADSAYNGWTYTLQRTNTYSSSWKYVELTAKEAVVDIEDWTYGDTAKTPSVYNIGKYPSGTTPTFSYGKKTGKFYTPISGTPSDAGNYGVKATLSNGADEGGYTDFTISPRNLSAVTVNLAHQKSYNGYSQPVNISSVKYGSKTLTDNTDYTITSGSTATNVGNTTLTLTGMGNYTGTKTVTWSLLRAIPDVTYFTVPTIHPQNYTGSPTSALSAPYLKSPYSGAGTVTVEYNGSISRPTNAGSYTVTFDVAQGTNFSAKTGLNYGTLIINKASGDPATVVSTATVKAGGTVNLKNNITGNAGTPSFKINGSAYGCTVNSSTGEFSAGTTGADVKVQVTFGASTNYYGGTKDITVTVVNKDTAALTVTQADTAYGTALADPQYAEKSWTTGPSKSYTGTTATGAAYSSSTKPTAAGNYVVTVTGEDENYIYSGSAAFKIDPKSIAGASVTFGAQDTYDGSSKEVLNMIVKDGSNTLTGSDYDIISGGAAIDVAEQQVTVEGKGNYTGTATSAAKWKLQKKMPAAGDFIITAPSARAYTGEATDPVSLPELKDGKSGCGEITVKYNGSVTPPADVGSYNVTFDVAEGTNFSSATGLTYGTLTINKVDFTGDKEVSSGGQVNKDITLDLTGYANNGTLGNVTVTAGGEYLSATPTISGKNLIFTFKSDTTVGSTATVTVQVTGCKNYNNYDLTVTLTAEPAHTLEHVARIEPTCTMNGSKEYWFATDADGIYFYDAEGTKPAFRDDLILSALGHDWGEWTVAKQPNSTETGIKERTCSRCGEKETEEIPVVPGVYGVSFSLNGKTGTAPASQTVQHGNRALKPTDPSADGFSFLGWYLDAEGDVYFDFNTPITGNTTLYAKWASREVKLYTVSFDLNGKSGTKPADQRVAEGGMAGSPVNPTAAGFIFRGWYRDRECKSLYDFADPVTADLTLYARWEEDVLPGAFKIFYTQSELKFDSYKGLTYNTENEHYEWTYTGSALIPAVTVTDHNGNVLTEGFDYTVRYSGNKNVSARPAKVIVTGKGNYSGSKSLEFYILKADLAKAKAKKLLTVPDSFMVQKGKKIAPIVIYQGMTLRANSDYKLSNTGAINGDTTVDIEGRGNYFTGKITGIPVKTLSQEEIKKKTIKVTLTPGKHVYNGSAHELSDKELVVKAGTDTTALVKGRDYKVIYSSNVNAGKAKLTVMALGSYVGNASKTFTIKPDTSSRISHALKSGTTVVYDPKGATPELDVRTDTMVLVNGRDYKVTYTRNKAKGEAGYRVSFLGNYRGQKSVTGKFTITEGSFAPAVLNAADIIYGKPNMYRSVPFVTIGGVTVNKRDYNVKYFDGAKELGAKEKISLSEGQNEKTITVKATGKNNYRAEDSAAFTYRVVKVTGDMINLSKTKIVGKDTDKKVKDQEYTGEYVTPAIDVLIKQGSTWVKVDPSNYSVTYINNLNKGKATILISGKGTGAVGSKSANFSIKAKNMSVFN